MTAVGLLTGLLLAWAGVRTIGSLAAARLPQLAGLSVDYRVIAFAVALAVLVAVVCGGLPAWRSSAVDPQDALRDGRGGGTSRAHHRVLQTLVVAEVALSLMLLLGAGLVLKGFASLMARDPGFDPEPILTLQTTISPQRYPDWKHGSAIPRAGARQDPRDSRRRCGCVDLPDPVRQLGLELQHPLRGPTGR
jgi:hypothetical protein